MVISDSGRIYMYLNDKPYSAKSLEQNYLVNIDPTVLIKLHSILSGEDVFNLKQLYDYSVELESRQLASMRLPHDFMHRLNAVDFSKIKEIARIWNNTREVELHNWSIEETENYLEKLIELSEINYDGSLTNHHPERSHLESIEIYCISST